MAENNTKKVNVYAVSDATGDLAFAATLAAARQFSDQNVVILRRSAVTTPEKIARVIMEVHENGGFIVFTLVSQSLREILTSHSKQTGVVAVDLTGPILDKLSEMLHAVPSDRPGLKYRFTPDYFKRNEAVEFTVKHDDGLGLESLHEADIILVGISRTSKTPLSIYLSYRGYKVANVPIVLGVKPPQQLFEVEASRIVGLTIAPKNVAEFRQIRLSKMGQKPHSSYADIETVRTEIGYAQKIFSRLGNCPVIDVTAKAIEEIASEILNVLSK